MAVPIFLFSVSILGLLLLILLAGCSFYLFRNYCTRRWGKAAKTSTEWRRQGLDAANKTTTDDENTLTGRRIKTHTFDQILKQEERSAYSVHPLDLPSPQQQAGGGSGGGGGADTQQSAAQAVQQSARGSA